MVDAHHVGQSTSHMSHVFLQYTTHPSPSRRSLSPQLLAFPQSVGGLSVCAHMLTQVYTEAYRVTDTKTNERAEVTMSSSS